VVALYERLVSGWESGLDYSEFQSRLVEARSARERLLQTKGVHCTHLECAEIGFAAADGAWRLLMTGSTRMVQVPVGQRVLWFPDVAVSESTVGSKSLDDVRAFIVLDSELNSVAAMSGGQIDLRSVLARAMGVARRDVLQARNDLDN
jgi:hypothetical protein